MCNICMHVRACVREAVRLCAHLLHACSMCLRVGKKVATQISSKINLPHKKWLICPIYYSVPFHFERAGNSHVLIEIIATGGTGASSSEGLLFWKWENHWFSAGNHQGESMVNDRGEMANGLFQRDIQLALYSFMSKTNCVLFLSTGRPGPQEGSSLPLFDRVQVWKERHQWRGENWNRPKKGHKNILLHKSNNIPNQCGNPTVSSLAKRVAL